MKPYYEKIPIRTESSFSAHERVCKSFELSWHYHPEYELTAIIEGDGRRYIGDSITDYKVAEVVMLPPNMPHSWQAAPDAGVCRAIVIQFSEQIFDSNGFELSEFAKIKELLNNCSGAVKFDNENNIIDLMRQVANTDGIKSFANLLNLLEQLSIAKRELITDCQAMMQKCNCERINNLLAYINANIGENLTLDTAAAKACLSKAAFCAFFKRITGKTFIEYVNDGKISLCCKMLRETEKPITEICFEAGFMNIANFNRQFRKRLNTSPIKYRKMY